MKESTVYRSVLEGGLAEGLAEGKAQAKREIAFKLLGREVEIDIIASSTGLSIEEVQPLQQQMNESRQS